MNGEGRCRAISAAVVWLVAVAGVAAAPNDPPYTYETFRFDTAPRKVVGVKYKAGDAKAALPLGGIGTGTVYFTSRGTFEGNALANTYRPIPGPMEGCFFAMRAESQGRSVARLLQTEPLYDWPTIESLTYFGHYPFVDIEYRDRTLPVEVNLRAMTPFIPGDSRASATPGAMFEFTISNPSEAPAAVSIAFGWKAPEAPARGVESRGNVDGFLTWNVGTLNPDRSANVPVVFGLAKSPEGVGDCLHPFNLSWPSPSTPPEDQMRTSSGDPVWLKDPDTDFAVDRHGGFNWEDQRRQAMDSPAGGCLSQHGFAVSYNDGQPKRAWTPVVGKSRLAGLDLVQPTQVDNAGKLAITRLRTGDGKLAVTVYTQHLEGPLVCRMIKVINLSDEPVRDIQVSVYANFEANHDETNDTGRLDPGLGAFLTIDSKTKATAFLAGAQRPVSGWAGTWGPTLERMADGDGVVAYEWARQERTLWGHSTPDRWTFAESSPKRSRAGCAIGVHVARDKPISTYHGWKPEGDGSDFWGDFAARGGWYRQRGGGGDGMAFSQTTTLQPGERKRLRFVLSWHYPDASDSGGKRVGHIYGNWFRDATAAGAHLARNWDDLWRRTGEWQEKVYDAPVPDWLKEQLVNSLYSMARNTSWLEDGRYTHSESFRGCPIMETIVCRFYGSIPLAMFFPDLEKNTMRQFMKHQRADGAIPFAFGRPERWDRPYYETQQSLDSAEFALMAWRDVAWWNDRHWAKEVYPAVKRAIRFAQTLDLDGDGVINDDVSMQYYDCWKFTGTSAYVGTIWLAALRAGEELAKMQGDAEFAAECRRWFEKAQASVERDLWTGRYYRLYNDPRKGRKSDTSLGNQLVGQWYAYLCGLGEILPRERVLTALRHVAEANGAASPFGLVNGVTPDGKRDTTGRNGHSNSITIGETYCYAATCVYAGMPDLGLPFARCLAENIALRQRSPWNTTWNMDPDTGEMLWGTEYYSNMCVWDLWGALLGRRTLDPL